MTGFIQRLFNITLLVLIIVIVFVEIFFEIVCLFVCFKLAFHAISSLAIQLREVSQTFGAFSRAACWRMKHWVAWSVALPDQSSMKKCDVTRLYAKCKVQVKSDTSLHQAINVEFTLSKCKKNCLI